MAGAAIRSLDCWRCSATPARFAAVSDDVRIRLQKALEAAGVEFIEENGGGPGVRLKKSQKKRT